LLPCTRSTSVRGWRMVALLWLSIPPSSSVSPKYLCTPCAKSGSGTPPIPGNATRSASLCGFVDIAHVARCCACPPHHRLLHRHPPPRPPSSVATLHAGNFPLGATVPAPACGYCPLRLLPRGRRMNRQRCDHLPNSRCLHGHRLRGFMCLRANGRLMYLTPRK